MARRTRKQMVEDSRGHFFLLAALYCIAAQIIFTERGLTVSYPDFSDNGENRNVFSKGGHKGAFSAILFFSNLIFLSSRDLNTKGK